MLMDLLPLLLPATFHGLIIVPHVLPQGPVNHRLTITEQEVQFTTGQKSNKSREIQSARKKTSQELVIQDECGCLLPATGLWAEVPCARNWREACPQLDRAHSQPGNGWWKELSLNSPSGCKIRTAIKSVCQEIWIHTFLLPPPARNRDYVMLKPWLRIQHLVSWTTSSAAVSLKWHLRNGHKIHLILPTASKTDIPYRRLAK